MATMMSRVGSAIVCFMACIVALRLVTLPWMSLGLFALMAALPILCGCQLTSSRHWWTAAVAPAGICVISITANLYITVLLVAAWLLFVSRNTTPERGCAPRQYAHALLLFALVDLTLLRHGAIRVILAESAHRYTGLIRESWGRGPVLGPDLLHLRFLVFTVVSALPLIYGCRRTSWLVALCQLLYVITLMTLVSPENLALYFACAAGPSIAAVLGMGPSLTNRVVLPRPRLQRWGVHALQIIGVIYFIVTLCLASSLSASPGDAPSILFVNDRNGPERGELDMTAFASPEGEITSDAFDEWRDQAIYDKLVTRLLPGLGYNVSLKDMTEVQPSDYARFNVVVLICLQHSLPSDHVGALSQAVSAGRTNVLIAGDHTDIRGVQKPFNDFMGPLGIKLNYDSAYPLSDWKGNLVFLAHPMNGPLPLCDPQIAPDPQFSVGATLDLTGWSSLPLVEAADGFSDLGTPNAPMYAGLGDMSYTENEVRGGLILAAERTLGRGAIVAFGDTAFLQNASIAHNFTYIASLFSYLSSSGNGGRTARLVPLAIASACAAIASLLVYFSTVYASSCIALAIITPIVASTYRPKHEIVQAATGMLTVIDDSHAEVTRNHDHELGSGTIIDMLGATTPCLTLACNAWDVIDAESLQCIVLLAPRGALSDREKAQLLEFLDRGGRVVFASGYYESKSHADWLRSLECTITPVTVGAGQQIDVVDSKYTAEPNIVEAWAMDLSGKWHVVCKCFDRPIAAYRDYGKGRIYVISDSYMLLDGAMSVGTHVNPHCFAFVNALIKDLQISH
jgi:hypothetical protein